MPLVNIYTYKPTSMLEEIALGFAYGYALALFFFLLPISIAILLACRSLWNGRKWAWKFLIVISVITIFIGITGSISSAYHPSDLLMCFIFLIVFPSVSLYLLNRPETKEFIRKMEVPAGHVKCPYCGSIVVEAKYCSNCGAKLK